jgi:hypothetical protein
MKEIKSVGKTFLIRKHYDDLDSVTISYKDYVEYYKMYIKCGGLELEQSLRHSFEIASVDEL